MNQELQAYRARQVMAVDPVTLVGLLYDKALTSLRAAAEAIRENAIEERWRSNNKAVEIIGHLLMTLDREKGGEIAANLEALYSYMLRRLVAVDTDNDARAAEEVIALLEPLRASWNEIARNREAFDMDPAAMTAAAGMAEGEDPPATLASPLSI